MPGTPEPTEVKPEERAGLLFAILRSYAPDWQARDKCDKFYQELLGAGLSAGLIEVDIMSALHDGLSYGNWLWVDFRTHSY